MNLQGFYGIPPNKTNAIWQVIRIAIRRPSPRLYILILAMLRVERRDETSGRRIGSEDAPMDS